MAKEYIEREALKEDLKESYERLRAIYDSLTYNEDKQICAGQLTTFTEAILRVKEAPAADVAEVRHGRWLCVDTDTEQFFLCNRCKKKEYWESNYCPNCGALMDKEQS